MMKFRLAAVKNAKTPADLARIGVDWHRMSLMFRGYLGLTARTMKFALPLSLIGLAGLASAQYTSQNITMFKHLTLAQLGTTAGNDVWGYTSPTGREYALVGGYDRTIVVEVTNPSNPVILASFAHTGSDWSDIKVYQSYAYVVSEGSGVGIQVLDLSNIDSGQVLLVKTVTNPGRTHNVAIDTYSGFLYTCGSNQGDATTMFFSLANPANPVKVGQWTQNYQHDAQIVTYTSGPYAGRQIFFGCSEGRGMDIIDVTNKSAPFRISRTPYPNVTYCHQGWLSPDRQYFYLDDELDEQTYGFSTNSRIFDVSNLTAPALVGSFSSGSPSIDHNQYVLGNYIFQANYRSGLRVFDRSNPTAPVQVGYFDTYPGSDANQFNGAWSSYPYFPSGNVIVNDIEGGLFVLDVTGITTGVTFTYPENKPSMINPDGGTTVKVKLTPRNTTVTSAKLKWTIGTVWNEVPMTSLGNDTFQAAFPAIDCGARVKFYVEALAANGKNYFDPAGASAEPNVAISQDSATPIFTDNGDTDLGWAVTNTAVSDGGWVRAVPVGNGGGRFDPPTADGGSGACFVTGNGANQDLDGGPTVLTSPTINCGGTGEYYVSYSRWYNSNLENDNFTVEISNNNGASWTPLENVTAASGVWTKKEFRVADFVPPTSTVKLRFTATDNPNDSALEAGVDSISVRKIECVTPVISGTVILQQFDGNIQTEPITVTLSKDEVVQDQRVVTLNASGVFSFTTSLRGRYNISIKGDHWLRKTFGETLVGAEGVNLSASLVNGDIDNDNAITIFDYVALSDAFDATEGAANWNALADLDGDGIISIFDYIILSANFDMTGDGY